MIWKALWRGFCKKAQLFKSYEVQVPVHEMFCDYFNQENKVASRESITEFRWREGPRHSYSSLHKDDSIHYRPSQGCHCWAGGGKSRGPGRSPGHHSPCGAPVSHLVPKWRCLCGMSRRANSQGTYTLESSYSLYS